MFDFLQVIHALISLRYTFAALFVGAILGSLYREFVGGASADGHLLFIGILVVVGVFFDIRRMWKN